MTIMLWISAPSIIPAPQRIISATWNLIIEQGLLRDMITSLTFCIKAMIYASIISLVLAYSSVIPIFKPLTTILSKARFLSTAGLTFIFALLAHDTSEQKTYLLVFAVSVFLITGSAAVVESVTKEEKDYARSLKMNEWKVVWHVIIRGKFDQMFELIRQNFAMAWMLLTLVENFCRADGGVGIILYDLGHRFKLDAVYGVQILILFTGAGCDYFLRKCRSWLFPYSLLKLEKK